VKTTVDGLLAEFASVVDALRCAIEDQHGIATRDGEIEPQKQIALRIGINVDDIVVDGGETAQEARSSEDGHRRHLAMPLPQALMEKTRSLPQEAF